MNLNLGKGDNCQYECNIDHNFITHVCTIFFKWDLFDNKRLWSSKHWILQKILTLDGKMVCLLILK